MIRHSSELRVSSSAGWESTGWRDSRKHGETSFQRRLESILFSKIPGWITRLNNSGMTETGWKRDGNGMETGWKRDGNPIKQLGYDGIERMKMQIKLLLLGLYRKTSGSKMERSYYE